MARDRVQVLGRLDAAPDAVWSVARDFTGAWLPGIATMREERGPLGQRIRCFTLAGEPGQYREQLTYFSDTDHCLGYVALEGIEGAEHYAARLTVAPSDKGGTAVSWSAEVRARAARLEPICAGTREIFEAGIEALGKAVAGTGVPKSPEAAPVPAVSHETVILPGTPQLALSVTPAPAPDRPLVLFLHGIGGSRHNWAAQLDAVAPYARAAALDLRGYGDSTLGFRPSEVDSYCEDILRVAAHFGARSLVLCGLSYGSWLAASFAMRHPGMLAGLVLSGGCTGMSEAGPEEREAFRVSREVPLDAGQRPADFAPAVVEVLAGPQASAQVRAHLRDSMAAIPAETYRDALRCFTNPLEKLDFARLTMPVLVMTGAHDRLAPPAELRAVAGRILDAVPRADVRFEVLDGAGHVCNVEAPQAYNAPLAALVARVAGQVAP